MILFLTGMPGAGKTTQGKRWSLQHGLKFADLDEMITAQYGNTVATIFHEEGEDAFRVLEQTVLQAVVHKAGDQHLLLACGGGTPCYRDNMSWMKLHGTVIWLKVPVRVLTEQIWNDIHTKRPLLERYKTRTELEEYLKQLREVRYPFYMQSDHQIELNDEIDSKFVALLNQLGYNNE